MVLWNRFSKSVASKAFTFDILLLIAFSPTLDDLFIFDLLWYKVIACIILYLMYDTLCHSKWVKYLMHLRENVKSTVKLD
jgi:hypothetical protein